MHKIFKIYKNSKCFKFLNSIFSAKTQRLGSAGRFESKRRGGERREARCRRLSGHDAGKPFPPKAENHQFIKKQAFKSFIEKYQHFKSKHIKCSFQSFETFLKHADDQKEKCSSFEVFRQLRKQQSSKYKVIFGYLQNLKNIF